MAYLSALVLPLHILVAPYPISVPHTFPQYHTFHRRGPNPISVPHIPYAWHHHTLSPYGTAQSTPYLGTGHRPYGRQPPPSTIRYLSTAIRYLSKAIPYLVPPYPIAVPSYPIAVLPVPYLSSTIRNLSTAMPYLSTAIRCISTKRGRPYGAAVPDMA
eukprot:593050-Rhodomonas_salina.2